eukprot:10659775-Alexandrium_andersonii.AAC.1
MDWEGGLVGGPREAITRESGRRWAPDPSPPYHSCKPVALPRIWRIMNRGFPLGLSRKEIHGG